LFLTAAISRDRANCIYSEKVSLSAVFKPKAKCKKLKSCLKIKQLPYGYADCRLLWYQKIVVKGCNFPLDEALLMRINKRTVQGWRV
jgi:hypothetical protein